MLRSVRDSGSWSVWVCVGVGVRCGAGVRVLETLLDNKDRLHDMDIHVHTFLLLLCCCFTS